MQRADGLRRDGGGGTARCAEKPNVQVREEGDQGTLECGMWATGRTD